MSGNGIASVLVILLTLCSVAHAQSGPGWVMDTSDRSEPSHQVDSADTAGIYNLDSSRFALGISIGVCGISAQDIVSLINQEIGSGAVTPNGFASAASFGGSLTVRPLEDFDLTMQYAFLSRSYSFGTVATGITSYSYDMDELTMLIHRVFSARTSTLNVGAGGGLLWGVMRRSYSENPNVAKYSATGGVINLQLLFRSAFGGHVFLHTELLIGFTFTGPLRDANGSTYELFGSSRKEVQLNTASGAVVVGLDYCF